MSVFPLKDAQFYRPVFSPWLGYGEFADFYRRAQGNTLVSPDRCYVLYSLARQALNVEGDFWECGVYRGGTAAMLAQVLARLPSARPKQLHLFDTFAGMPDTDRAKDLHQAGDFSDTSIDAVRHAVKCDGIVRYHQGLIPNTFRGLEGSAIAFAHVDVDIYRSVLDCCQFIYPRLSPGGVMVFDDYGFATCPGARSAVDEYFAASGTFPLILPTGQALVFKSA